jgi:hypothetical protein
MTSCVNRNCSRPLASFLEGRLFHFEVTSISVSADDSQKQETDEVPRRTGVYFWLCGTCAASMTLILEPVGGLQLVPFQHFMETSTDSPSAPIDALLGALQQG